MPQTSQQEAMAGLISTETPEEQEETEQATVGDIQSQVKMAVDEQIGDLKRQIEEALSEDEDKKEEPKKEEDDGLRKEVEELKNMFKDFMKESKSRNSEMDSFKKEIKDALK